MEEEKANVVNDDKVDKLLSDLNSKIEEIKALKSSIKQKNEEIVSLNSLKSKVLELEEKNQNMMLNFQKSLVQEKARSAISATNAFDQDLVLNLMDLNSVINNTSTIDDQLKEIQKTKSFLFKSNEVVQPTVNLSGTTPANSTVVTPESEKSLFLKDLGSRLAKLTNRLNGK